MKLPYPRHLIAYLEVARLQRLRPAADIVNLSQPAVSHAIGKLESLCQASLFDRRPKGMFLTDIGKIFRRRAERAVMFLQKGAQGARRRAGQGRPDFHKLATPAQLHALVALAQARSYSQAARDLGAKQPAVHRAAQDLQALADLKLFEPARRGVILSPAAETLAQNVRLAMAELRLARFEIDFHKGRDRTRILVGSLPLARTAILPQATHHMLGESGSGLQIRNIEAPYESLLDALRHGDLDMLVGPLRDPAPAPDVVQEQLFEDRLSIVAAPDHPLQNACCPTLEHTLCYPWIAPPKESPAGSYLFEHLRIQDQPETPVRVVSSSLAYVRGLMAEGDYVTIMSEAQFALERQQGLMQPLRISLCDNVLRVGLTVRRDWAPTQTQERFLAILRKLCGAESALQAAGSDS